jgi:hypothetical protein
MFRRTGRAHAHNFYAPARNTGVTDPQPRCGRVPGRRASATAGPDLAARQRRRRHRRARAAHRLEARPPCAVDPAQHYGDVALVRRARTGPASLDRGDPRGRAPDREAVELRRRARRRHALHQYRGLVWGGHLRGPSRRGRRTATATRQHSDHDGRGDCPEHRDRDQHLRRGHPGTSRRRGLDRDRQDRRSVRGRVPAGRNPALRHAVKYRA